MSSSGLRAHLRAPTTGSECHLGAGLVHTCAPSDAAVPGQRRCRSLAEPQDDQPDHAQTGRDQPDRQDDPAGKFVAGDHRGLARLALARFHSD